MKKSTSEITRIRITLITIIVVLLIGIFGIITIKPPIESQPPLPSEENDFLSAYLTSYQEAVLNEDNVEATCIARYYNEKWLQYASYFDMAAWPYLEENIDSSI